MLCGDPGAQSGQLPAQGHTLSRLQDSKICPPCLPASLFFPVPWRVLNSQACRAGGGRAERPAWGLPGRASSVRQDWQQRSWAGSSALFSALEGGGCTWHHAHIPTRLPLNSSQQGGLGSCCPDAGDKIPSHQSLKVEQPATTQADFALWEEQVPPAACFSSPQF